MVPGSTLMYGSNFWRRTRRPRCSSSMPIEAQVRPLPRELTTPPVTKMCLLMSPCPRAAQPNGGSPRDGPWAPVFPHWLLYGPSRPEKSRGGPLAGSGGPDEPLLPIRPDEVLIVLKRVHAAGGVRHHPDVNALPQGQHAQ